MLGVLGFSFAALILILFAYSSRKLAKNNKSYDSESFRLAYLFMSLAMAVWGFGLEFGLDNLNTYVLIGDALMMFTTLFLAKTVLTNKSKSILAIFGILLISALVYRSFYLNPYVSDGILIFKTPTIFGIFLTIIFVTVWIRANLYYFDEIISKKSFGAIFRPAYFAANIFGFVSVFAFLFAGKKITIIVGFIGIIVSYLTMTAINLYAINYLSKAK